MGLSAHLRRLLSPTLCFFRRFPCCGICFASLVIDFGFIPTCPTVDSIMRALFTQFSLLVAALTGTHLMTADTSTFPAILWGMSAGLIVYGVLLLGDWSVHRFLEDASTSARIADGAPYVEVDERDEIEETRQTVAA